MYTASGFVYINLITKLIVCRLLIINMSQSKMTNTVRKLVLVGPPQSEVPASGLFIDIAQCLSTVNRKTYRQGMNYAISNITITSLNSGEVQVFTLPNNWCMDNATTKIFELWKKQRAEVLKEQPSLKAAWSDFKVFMTPAHAAAGVSSNLTPYGSNAGLVTPYLLGEWAPSEITTPVLGGAAGGSHQSTIHVVGDNVPVGNFQPGVTTSVSAIQQYADSRALVAIPDPVPPGTAFRETIYTELASHDEMAREIVNDLVFQNDTPPYDRDHYPGGRDMPFLELVDNALITNYGDSLVSSMASTGPFVPALGLINIVPNMLENANVVLEIDLVPGNYKGVLAERGL